MLDRDDLELRFGSLRQVDQILQVLFRQYTVFNPARCAARTFSRTPPIGSDASAQGDLASHAHMLEHRASGQRRDDRGRHGDPSRWTIFWDPTFRHVDVNIHAFKHIHINAQEAPRDLI